MKSVGKSIGPQRLSVAALGIGVILGPSVAQAQTVSRQITSEPVETTVTQYPNGTEVTRRILSPEPNLATGAAPLGTMAPLSSDALTPRYVEPAAPALTRRQVATGDASIGESTRVTPASRTPRTRTTRTHVETTRTVAVRRAPPSTVGVAVAPRAVASRAVARPVAPPPVSDAALVLSPAQRQIIYGGIYRTVVEPEYFPAPATSYPLAATYPTNGAYAYAPAPDYAYDPYTGYRAGYAYADRDPYSTAYRWDGVPLVVGARMPASVPLVLMPQPVALNVPVVQPYSYAVLDGRVYLVDPATRVIVAAINQ